MLGYHISVWGTDIDIALSNPPDATVDQLAGRAAAFYKSLAANFDVAFAEFSDRDSGFYQFVYGDGGHSWWDAEDFRRNVRFLNGFSASTGKRIVMWQIPLGNTKMRVGEQHERSLPGQSARVAAGRSAAARIWPLIGTPASSPSCSAAGRAARHAPATRSATASPIRLRSTATRWRRKPRRPAPRRRRSCAAPRPRWSPRTRPTTMAGSSAGSPGSTTRTGR